MAKDLLSYYHASDPFNTPGLFGDDSYGGPYNWWEAGAVWGGLIDYWNYTGDDQYVGLVQQALLWQLGPHNDYRVPNQTKEEVRTPCLIFYKKSADRDCKFRQTMSKQSGL